MNNSNLLEKDVTFLSQVERFKLIHSAILPEKALLYLIEKLQNLKIEILGDYSGNIIELMNRGLLEGWCWETTESAIMFLESTDYISKFKTYIVVDISAFAEKWVKELVKKTVNIPKWINTKAEELKINFSKTLEEALLEKIMK